ncbi:hypothetical protein D3C81_2199490 [compost metagenome]
MPLLLFRGDCCLLLDTAGYVSGCAQGQEVDAWHLVDQRDAQLGTIGSWLTRLLFNIYALPVLDQVFGR